jgi:hypothetical protein
MGSIGAAMLRMEREADLAGGRHPIDRRKEGRGDGERVLPVLETLALASGLRKGSARDSIYHSIAAAPAIIRCCAQGKTMTREEAGTFAQAEANKSGVMMCVINERDTPYIVRSWQALLIGDRVTDIRYPLHETLITKIEIE